jgi:large repetitive protein
LVLAACTLEPPVVSAQAPTPEQEATISLLKREVVEGEGAINNISGIPNKAGAITISPATLPDWTINSAYSQTLTAIGCSGACVWSSSGNLPPGLSLSTVTGTITGIPNKAGSFQFMITASDLLKDKGYQGSHSYSVRINAAPAITTSSLPDGTLGGAYSQTIQVSNGTSPYTFSLVSGALPAGLGLSASSGTISGTPTSAGPSNFTISVIDAAQAATSRVYILTIDAPLTITTNGVLPGGSAGSAYSQTLAASGGTPPYTWSVSSGTLPSGLSLNASTGILSGSLSASGTFTFTVQVADSNHATASGNSPSRSRRAPSL